MVYVQVAVNVPQASGVFDYHLPPELFERVQPGSLVIVPFGSQQVHGVVLRTVEQPQVAQTRAVAGLVDEAAVLTEQQIALAQWLAEAALAPLSACIALMLPPGLGQQTDTRYRLQGVPAGELSPAQRRLVGLLQKHGPLRGAQLDRKLPQMDWRSAARSLVRSGVIATEAVLPAPRVHPRVVRTARLACSPEQAQAALSELGRPGSQAAARRQAMLRCLLAQTGPVEVAWIYAECGGSLADLRFLSERGLVELGSSEVWRDPLAQLTPQPYLPPPLTPAQQAVWQQVRQRIAQAAQGQSGPVQLLHGVTGSGKTEIYLHAVQETLALGRQAIVLVPEIALTPQTVQRFVGRFPGRVGLMHSGLSDGERYDTWRRARAGEFDVIVGPRSALFVPFRRLGLLVVDECHDGSYYQSEAAPYFHAREAAVAYASLVGAACLLGSATPDLESYFRARRGEWQLLELPQRILAHQQAVEGRRPQPAGGLAPEVAASNGSTELPPVVVIDMRDELKSGNRSIFSLALQNGLRRTLEQGQQAILFLNRRGAATYVFCRDCGLILRCPRCEVPLTFHEELAGNAPPTLRCHYCNYQRRMPSRCPGCGGQRIRQYGTGTQKVEAEVKALFPQARTLRWDYETTRRKGAHDAILHQFASQQADILIGTQMLAKGLDLPLVTLVGVVLADVGLSMPDFRAGERVFQVLTQVAGRAGRSPLGGEVILQTFQPDHYVIRAAAQHDYAAFYRQELEFRHKLGYPPFTALVRLEYRHRQAEIAERRAREMAALLQQWIAQAGASQTRLIGPAPCFFARLAGLARWQILLCGPNPAALLRGRKLGDWKVEVNPPTLL